MKRLNAIPKRFEIPAGFYVPTHAQGVRLFEVANCDVKVGEVIANCDEFTH